MCFENFKNSSNDAVSLAPLQVRKGFCLRGHVGYYSKSQVQLTRCLRGAYAQLTRNLAIMVGKYNQKNRTVKKTHKETIVEGTTGRFQLMKWCHQYYKYFAASVEYPLSNVISYANSPTSQNPHVKPNQNLNTFLLSFAHATHVLTHSAYAAHSWQTPYATLRQPGFAYAKCSYDKALIKTIKTVFGVAHILIGFM